MFHFLFIGEPFDGGIVVVSNPRPLTCEGNVLLQPIDESRMLNDLRFFASGIAKRNVRGYKIRRRGYEVATVEGSCRWKAWSSIRGGSFHVMSSAGVHEPGFTIRRISLLRD